MEYAQLESRVSFLDSEYRREKAELAQVRHKLELSEAEKGELARRVESLEAELLELKASLSKIGMLESTIERFKGEMMTAMEEQRLVQKRTLKEAERARTVELESQTKAINEIGQKIERSRNLDELITLARTETDRQGAVQVAFQQRLDMLTKQNDERLRSVSYLEEQRRTDAKRISEIKLETEDLFKQSALQLSKIELIQQQIPQFGPFQIELARVKEAVRAEVERVQYQFAQTDRTVKTWNTVTEQMQRRLDEYENRMERYAEHYQRNIKALEALQGFQEELKRAQHEFMELNRLNADRLRNQSEEWQSTQEQTLRKISLENDRRLTEAVKPLQSFDNRIEELKAQLPGMREQLTVLLKIVEEDILNRAIAAREWQSRFEQLVTEGK